MKLVYRTISSQLVKMGITLETALHFKEYDLDAQIAFILLTCCYVECDFRIFFLFEKKIGIYLFV